ncbi:hypothetical protein ACEQPO_04955 [Bacillus sp. SL00103]
MTALAPSAGEKFSADFEDWFYIPVWERSAPVLKERASSWEAYLGF